MPSKFSSYDAVMMKQYTGPYLPNKIFRRFLGGARALKRLSRKSFLLPVSLSHFSTIKIRVLADFSLLFLQIKSSSDVNVFLQTGNVKYS